MSSFFFISINLKIYNIASCVARISICLFWNKVRVNWYSIKQSIWQSTNISKIYIINKCSKSTERSTGPLSLFIIHVRVLGASIKFKVTNSFKIKVSAFWQCIFVHQKTDSHFIPKSIDMEIFANHDRDPLKLWNSRTAVSFVQKAWNIITTCRLVRLKTTNLH